jgi:PilZ domain
MSIVESALRAPRFAVDVPVRVRHVGAAGWQSGQALNISRSGLLVAVRGSFRCDDTIEAIVELSQATAGVGDVRVRGRVARVEQAGGLMQVGTTIDEYRLQRPDASDSLNAPAVADHASDAN